MGHGTFPTTSMFCAESHQIDHILFSCPPPQSLLPRFLYFMYPTLLSSLTYTGVYAIPGAYMQEKILLLSYPNFVAL